jgi:hypothetical protein
VKFVQDHAWTGFTNLIIRNVGASQLLQMHEESQAVQLERLGMSSKGSPKTQQSVRRMAQRNVAPSSPVGRPQADLSSSPSGRRSLSNKSVTAVPEPKSQSDPPDLMRF